LIPPQPPVLSGAGRCEARMDERESVTHASLFHPEGAFSMARASGAEIAGFRFRMAQEEDAARFEKGRNMAIRTTVVGSYPKPPDEGKPFTLRKTLHAIEKGEADEGDLRGAQDDLVREVIAEQEAAGIDVVTDGLVRWDDIVTPFARTFEGFAIGGLLRWFDNNVYYRRPICVGPVEWRRPASVDAFRFAQSVARGPVKAVIPGPVTFARLSVDEHYGDHSRFTAAVAAALGREAAALQEAGAAFIQIDEPSLLDAPEDIELARRSLGVVTNGLTGVETTLATYFGDAKRVGADIFSLPVSRLGFDLVSGAENMELVRSAPPDVLFQAGVVDARNTKLEDLGDLARSIEQLAGIVGPERLSISPSAGLEFLPREKARLKLRRLVEAVEKVEV
jgi:5-methyltetrahydropteroyltriglutamate--homocysteine methyltransferase